VLLDLDPTNDRAEVVVVSRRTGARE
jgi:hypothetical protein